MGVLTHHGEKNDIWKSFSYFLQPVLSYVAVRASMKLKLSGANVASFLLGFSSFLITKSLGQIVYLEVAALLFLFIKFIRRAIGGRNTTETHLSKDGKLLLFFGFIWFLDQGFSFF